LKKSIGRSSFFLMIALICVKLVGFVRQIIIASYYGANIETDIFFLSSGILSNIIYFISTSLSVVLLPKITEKLEKKGREEAGKFISRAMGFFIPVAGLITVGVFAGSRGLAAVLAPAYSADMQQLLAEYIRFMSPTLIFSTGVCLFQTVQNGDRRYFGAQFVNIVYSIVTILLIILFYDKWGIYCIIFAYPISYLIEIAILALTTRKSVKVGIKFPGKDPEIRSIIKLIFPVIISCATIQINQIVDKIIASTSPAGSVSSLSYAAPLQDVVASVVTSSIITVFFTELSSAAIKGNKEEIGIYLKKGVQTLAIVLIPCSLVYIFLARDIISILYGRGAFSEDAVLLTASCLMGYAIGFLFYGIREIYAKTFYAVQNTKTPARNGVITIACNIALSILLSKQFGVVGISAATSISAIIGCALMYFSMKKKYNDIEMNIGKKNIFKLLTATVAALIAVYMIMNTWKLTNEILVILFAFLIIFGVFFVMLFLLRYQELEQIVKKLKYKIFNRRKHNSCI